ncbi:MAG TPA: hypothetical protein VFS05_11675 [Gemmatimonadaceae bacterium]|nr:hypothetical protein [Gemmatimonadaceae bacterium]
MHRTPLALLLVLSIAACGGGASADDAAADSAVEEVAATPEAAPQPAQPAAAADASGQPLTAADIDRYERGLDAELAAVAEAAKRMKGAKSGTDTLAVLGDLQESATADAGAKAAGVGVERYRAIRTNLSSAAAAVAPLELEFAPEMLTPEMRAEMQKGRDATLQRLAPVVPAEVVEALRPRAASLRKKELQLAGERLKAAGA